MGKETRAPARRLRVRGLERRLALAESLDGAASGGHRGGGMEEAAAFCSEAKLV